MSLQHTPLLQGLDEGDHLAETPGNSNEMGEEGRVCRPGAMKTKNCIYCDEEVPILQLMSHLESHEQQQYPCPYCSFKAPRLTLSRHIQQQHQEFIMTCEMCCAKFLESDLYRKHLESHCVGLHHCSECGKIFGTEDELHNHANIAHIPKGEDNYSCSLCNKTYTSRFKYISHALKFHKGGIHIEGVVWGGRGLLACNICEKRFKKASLFIAHEKTHRTRKFHCHYCLNKYPSELFLHDHLLTHQFGDYDCTDCLVKFASRNQLNIHKEKMHNHKVNRVCEYCNREFREYIQLISHKRKVHPESEESQKAKYTCSDCGRKFMVKGNFLRHKKLHEKGKSEKKCACEICGKLMSNKYALASHLNTHTRESSLKCKICDKTFVTKYTLLDHVRRIHDEIGSGRDKICKQCGRSFFTNAELKYHLKTHTGERPYRCEMCGETYLSSSTLRYHMQKHSNVMFVCQDCQAKFKNYVGWSAHMKRVHGVTCVKDYTREHGILQAVLEKESPLYIVAQGHAKTVDTTQNISSKESLEKECLNSATLAVGLEETVVSLPGKEVGNIIHVVSYDDLANPLVHTVDAAEVGLIKPEPEEACITQPSSNLPSSMASGNASMDPGGDGNYPQNSERTRVMIPEGWEVILPTESEESQVVMTGGWEDARIAVPQTSEESQMVLASEWEETQGMAQLVISEEGEETRVVMTSWKDCVDY